MTKSFDERNALKSRKVCAAMAERADTGKRKLTERERQILDMWPRFEDGEYVWFGDEFLCRCGKSHVCDGVRVQNTGAKVIFAANHPHNIFLKDGSEYSERVKRPFQSVLDADGMEIKVGDTVWHEDGSEWLVEEVDRYGARCFDGDKRRTFNPKYLTHTRPATKVLDADGVEIHVGDTVWHCIGIYDELVVEEIDDESGWVRTRSANGACLSVYNTHLTHTRPDSWEQLEEDAEFNDETGIVGGNLDIVRRAKALAGVEVKA